MSAMIGILVFINWSSSGDAALGWWDVIFIIKFIITGVFALALIYMLIRWFKKYELKEWVLSTRDFAIQILPLLFIGVLAAGFILGRPYYKGILSTEWVGQFVGGNSLLSNFIASFSGAFMYFATLTEVPILQILLGKGMGQGPALALLLAGPSLSLPSMIIIKRELGWVKTITYVMLVVTFSTVVGMIYGTIVS